jgi:hypothetical protein
MPFDPLDVFDDDECAARAEAEALELETLRLDSYGRNLTLGHVVREFTEAYRQTAAYLELSPAQRARQERVLRDLLGCRTSALGEHEWHCGSCDRTYVYFNSCGNRHCPTCREGYRREWAEKVALDLLPVPYEHVILTLPRPLTQLVMAHDDALYSTVMQAGGAALMAVGKKFLGAQLAGLGMLHTWGCLTARPESARKICCSPATCHADGGLRAAPVPAWTSCRLFQPASLSSRRIHARLALGRARPGGWKRSRHRKTPWHSAHPCVPLGGQLFLAWKR